jgi:hypothetical protein
MSAMLLGALVLYAAGAGPASYYETRFMITDGRQGSVSGIKKLRGLYWPLQTSVKGTPLQTPLENYCDWWSDRAWKQYPRSVCVSSGFWSSQGLE